MIELHNVTKKYGDRWVLQSLDLKVYSGERLVVLGPSGCGKTTLMRLIAGLEYPDGGEIHINGRLVSDPHFSEEPSRRNLGVVFQQPSLWPHLTVAQNILFGLQHLEKGERDRRLKLILEQIGLTGFEKRMPSHLSGGEARRVALARALVIQPDWLLMDEPLTNLDLVLKNKLIELILTVIPAETGLVYITHDEFEAEKISQNLFSMPDLRIKKVPDETV
jgi:iron(III) transport system ATP-binding protein